ncbi:MAG: hypothetical protein ACU84Q_13840 [Gammaproteobacteria bacterium]|jgi:hypothetical protein
MSTDLAEPGGISIGSTGDHALRFGFGLVTALVIAWIIDVPMAFLAPMFAMALLVPTSSAPGLPKLLALPIVIGLLSLLVEAVGAFFAPWSDVLLLLFALVLFVCFHSDAVRGPGPIAGLVLTVTLVVGTLAANADPVAQEIINSMFWAALSASLASLFIYSILPVPDQRAVARAKSEEVNGQDSVDAKRNPTKIAAVRTVIALPIIIWFIAEDVVGNFFILLVAINILRLDMPKRGGLIAIASNVIGAVVALIFTVMIDAVPSVFFGVLLFLGIALVLGLELEKGGVRAELAQAALSTAIILIAVAIAPIDESGQAVDRVTLVLAIVVYVLLARTMIERPIWSNSRRSHFSSEKV